MVPLNDLVLFKIFFFFFFNDTATTEIYTLSLHDALPSSALSLLLPHGYEGQGPDHSSGRPERFLQLAAENNMTVAICSSPANYFHLLRRQGLSPVRRPLVAFTPKSLLRLKSAVSQLDDFTTGTFRPVIDDNPPDPSAVRRVLLCSGKIYY